MGNSRVFTGKRVGIMLALFVLSVGLSTLLFPRVFNVKPIVVDQDSLSPEARRFVWVYIAGRPFELEVSETPAQIQQGLSDRSSVSGNGMMFILPIRSTPRFWMKDMRIDLDFVWVDRNTVVDLHENIPAPSESQNGEDIIVSPSGMVTHVIELPAGMIQREGIQLGDRVEF